MSRYSHDDFIPTPTLWTFDDQKEFERRVTAANRDPRDFRVEPVQSTFGGGIIKIHNIVTDKKEDYSFNSNLKEQLFDSVEKDIRSSKFD